MKCKECKFSNEKRVCYKTGEIEQAHDNDDTYCAYYEPISTGQDNKGHNNVLYQCHYNKACKCDMTEPCLGCEDFKPIKL